MEWKYRQRSDVQSKHPTVFARGGLNGLSWGTLNKNEDKKEKDISFHKGIVE